MRRILAMAAVCSLLAGAAYAEEAPEARQLDLAFVCGTALDSQKHYANNLIAWLQARCNDGFITEDVCKEIDHYVDSYASQVTDSSTECAERLDGED